MSSLRDFTSCVIAGLPRTSCKAQVTRTPQRSGDAGIRRHACTVRSTRDVALTAMRWCVVVVIAVLLTASCVGEFDNVEKYAGETVYPAAFDTIVAHFGYERVEFDLWKAGRVRASEMQLGKAVRTIVEYDGVKHTIDSLCSWVNVTGLTQGKLYRIKIYTEDKYNNASVPRSMAVLPFTSIDRDMMYFPPPRLTVYPTGVIAEWANSLNSITMEFHGMSWRYRVAENQPPRIDSTKNAGFLATGFTPASEANFDVTYKVVPKLPDGRKLIDTLRITRPLNVRLLPAETAFFPAERATLVANGVTIFTTAEAARFTHLTFPLHTSSFADLFYFPSLRSLDLTGAGLQNVLPALNFARNDVVSVSGGGGWQPFMRRVEQEEHISITAIFLLANLLETGQLTHVRYIAGTMGLDDILAPYVANGAVELVGDDDPLFADPAYIEPQFFVNGLVESADFRMDNFYSGDFLPRRGFSDIGKFNPLNESMNGEAINLRLDQLTPSQRDGRNIYKCVIRRRSASFVMALPVEYMFDSRRYPYLKFKMFCGTAREDMTGQNAPFLTPWIRPMNRLSMFPYNSMYGPGGWDVRFNPIPVDDIRNNWVEYTVDMSANNWWGADINTTGNGNGFRRNRVIIFNIGQSPSAFVYDENKEVVLYVADIRFCRE